MTVESCDFKLGRKQLRVHKQLRNHNNPLVCNGQYLSRCLRSLSTVLAGALKINVALKCRANVQV